MKINVVLLFAIPDVLLAKRVQMQTEFKRCSRASWIFSPVGLINFFNKTRHEIYTFLSAKKGGKATILKSVRELRQLLEICT